eukprot:5033889-Amphidinium_carterae.1
MGSCERPLCAPRAPRTALVRAGRRVAGPATEGGVSGEQGWMGSSRRPRAGAGLVRVRAVRDRRACVRERRAPAGGGLSPLGVLDRPGRCLRAGTGFWGS